MLLWIASALAIDVQLEDARSIGDVVVALHRHHIDGIPVVDSGELTWTREGVVRTQSRARVVELAFNRPVQPPSSAIPAGLQAELGPELWVLPGALRTDGGEDDRLVWAALVRGPRVRYKNYVDAVTGDVLRVENARFAVSGTVYGEHAVRTVGDPIVTSPLPWIRVDSADGTTYAATDGSYDSGGSAVDATVRLRGEHLRVINADTDNAEVTVTGDFTFTTAHATESEIAAYVYINQSWQRALELRPDLKWLNNATMTARVDMDEPCNAFWAGEFQFGLENNRCVNTALIADVAHHEFGHGLHEFSLIGEKLGNLLDNAMTEAVADFWSCTLLDDAEVAPGFFKSGKEFRRCDTDRHWLEGIVTDPHKTALTLSGAMWKVREQLIARDGEAGKQLMDELHVRMLATAGELPSAYAAMVAADDGSNLCEIRRGFHANGLGPVPGSRALALHTPTRDGVVHIEALEEPCDVDVSGVVRWRSEDGSGEIGLENGGATIPGTGWVEYQFELDVDGQTVVLPDGSETEEWFAFRTDSEDVVFFDDFESKQAWTSGVRRFEVNDDWQRGKPGGKIGDPLVAWSGDKVWGNDVGRPDYNGSYPPGDTNWSDITIDATGYTDLRLSFRRWLTLADDDVASIEVNGDTVWKAEGHWDSHWYLQEIELSVEDGPITIRFELDSNGGNVAGGWNIDDVRVTGTALEVADVGEAGREATLGKGRACETGPSGVWGLVPRLLQRR